MKERLSVKIYNLLTLLIKKRFTTFYSIQEYIFYQSQVIYLKKTIEDVQKKIHTKFKL